MCGSLSFPLPHFMLAAAAATAAKSLQLCLTA